MTKGKSEETINDVIDETSDQIPEETLDEIVDSLTLFDDDLMGLVFGKNIEATEQVLQIVLGRKIKIKSVTGQREMRNPEVEGRRIILDVHAIDVDGQHIDIEFQNDYGGAHVRRARYHSSTMDTRMLKKKQNFSALRDSYVIFFYKQDKFRKDLPLYHVERYVEETEQLFGDGSHIIYVNGEYTGNDEIGSLIRDFYQTNPEKIHNKVLAESVKYYKWKEGRKKVCEAVERYGDRREKRGEKRGVLLANINAVQSIMDKMEMSLEQALNLLNIQGEERYLISKEIK